MHKWSFYLAQLEEAANRSMTSDERFALRHFPLGQMSIAGLWSWRGSIFKKYMGFMPTPEEIGMDPSDSFFDPDYICEVMERNLSNEPIQVFFYHHGRKIRRNEKRWKHHVLPRIAELQSAGQWPEGCTVNGQPL